MKTRLSPLLALLLIAFLPRAEAARARLPAEVFRALDAPAEITLYSTDPDFRAFHWWLSRWFHGYRIIGKVSVADPAQRRQVAAVVRHAAQTYTGDTKCIFSPRHGVRVTSGSRTYDILICFECMQMAVYSGERTLSSLSVTGDPTSLNQILRAAHIRIAP